LSLFPLSPVVIPLTTSKRIARILFIGKLDKTLRIGFQNESSFQSRYEVGVIIGYQFV